MKAKARLDQLVKRLGRTDGDCVCPGPANGYVIVHPEDGEPPDTTCPTCGRPRPQIIVQYIHKDVWEAI